MEVSAGDITEDAIRTLRGNLRKLRERVAKVPRAHRERVGRLSREIIAMTRGMAMRDARDPAKLRRDLRAFEECLETEADETCCDHFTSKTAQRRCRRVLEEVDELEFRTRKIARQEILPVAARIGFASAEGEAAMRLVSLDQSPSKRTHLMSLAAAAALAATLYALRRGHAPNSPAPRALTSPAAIETTPETRRSLLTLKHLLAAAGVAALGSAGGVHGIKRLFDMRGMDDPFVEAEPPAETPEGSPPAPEAALHKSPPPLPPPLQSPPEAVSPVSFSPPPPSDDPPEGGLNLLSFDRPSMPGHGKVSRPDPRWSYFAGLLRNANRGARTSPTLRSSLSSPLTSQLYRELAPDVLSSFSSAPRFRLAPAARRPVSSFLPLPAPASKSTGDEAPPASSPPTSGSFWGLAQRARRGARKAAGSAANMGFRGARAAGQAVSALVRERDYGDVVQADLNPNDSLLQEHFHHQD